MSSENDRYKTLFEKSADAMLIIDDDQFVDCNMATVKMLGYKNKQELYNTHPSVLSPPTQPDGRDSYEKANEMISIAFEKGSHRFEWDHKRFNGEIFPVEVLLTPITSDNKTMLHVVWRDITERKKAHETISYQAKHDLLTGLYNRYEFERRVKNILEDIEGNDEHALCYLDLDQFKIVNDTCGHTAGDELLRQIGTVLKKAISARDLLARLGGDEFGVLLEYCTISDAQRVTTSILQAIQEYQFVWEGRVFKLGVSIGLVPVTGLTKNLKDLLRDADAACYTAKDKGRNCIHISMPDDADVARVHGQLELVNNINEALSNDSFVLYGQTIESLSDKSEIHCEILVRMKVEDELLLPGEFLPAAERYNLTTKLDYWVIENTLDLLSNNPSIYDSFTSFSINLSGASVSIPETADFIISKINNSELDANKICFEITETAAISNLVQANELIQILQGLGCKFALDDFGSGLSSFSYLKNLPVDYLKIDGLFVRDIVDDPIDLAMVKSINEVGHLMKMKTIAEYVENEKIKEILNDINVDYAQGYYLSEPVKLITLPTPT